MHCVPAGQVPPDRAQTGKPAVHVVPCTHEVVFPVYSRQHVYPFSHSEESSHSKNELP
jgi:hypothetical protein